LVIVKKKMPFFDSLDLFCLLFYIKMKK